MISVQYYLINFNYYLSVFHIFICILIYTFVILSLFFNYLYKIDKEYLAFNINILYITSKSKNICSIKKISFVKFNKEIARREFYTVFSNFLKYIEKDKSKFTLKHLNILKISGFIHSINYAKIIINNKKYYQLFLECNPIIKSITIDQQSHLIISSNKLQQVLNKHLGLPINYKLLNKSLQAICLWYKLQGFEWVKIKLMHNKHINDIKIIIMEGNVLSSNIICTNKKKVKNYLFINNGIERDIEVLYRHVLNKNNLDTTIQKIKNKYILEDISYKVIAKKKGLDISIKYLIKSEQSIHIKYIPDIFYSMYNSLKNYKIEYVLSMWKLKNIIIYQYNLKYILKIKIHIINYILLFFKIYFMNSDVYQYLHSFNLLIYHYSHLIYSFSLIWFKNTLINIPQQIFLIHLISFEINNESCISQYIKCIQRIYYLVNNYYSNYISINKFKYYQDKLLQKYKREKLSHILYYKVQITNHYYLQILNIINYFIINTQYCLYFDFNNIDYRYIKLYSQLFKLYINNKFIVQIKENLCNIEIKLNILKILTKKVNNLNYRFCKSYIDLYVNYSFHINKYNKIYIFNNYIYFLNYPERIFDLHNLKNFLGLGLQINIPFKQITYIRLEYIINMKRQIYLFMDKFSV
uniref:POTRA domain-containing protein n=1 Tax=Ceramothamnion japonicum TaxID=218448 RepID=A0A1C9CD73_CERJP|nr:hypothetical protein Ceram_054 [Ceramium japonicum]AOM66330.1 hypothetical protein Ceram_054 [Ceramium japonicum]